MCPVEELVPEPWRPGGATVALQEEDGQRGAEAQGQESR